MNGRIVRVVVQELGGNKGGTGKSLGLLKWQIRKKLIGSSLHGV